MSASLIVPINLRALCVGKQDPNSDVAHFADIAADFSTMPYLTKHRGRTVVGQPGLNLGQVVTAPAFSEVPCPDPGVHLHWALPDALARGVTDASGTVQIPAAPNRWLVVRIASNRSDTAKLTAWVVESDRLWDPDSDGGGPAANRLSRAYPLMQRPAIGKPFLSLGRVFDYDSWPPNPGGAYSTPHTTLGYGELSFAAAYPHAPNCFGLWDGLRDVAPDLSMISYLVAGWYAADDPLAKLVPAGTSAKDARAALEQHLAWTFSDDVATSAPTSTVCSGLLTGIAWDPSSSYLKASTDDLDVAVGNTAAEALSAMLANRPEVPSDPGLEQALNALQLGLLGQLEEPEGPIVLEQKLHQTTFASTTGGSLWVVRPGEDGKIPAVGAALDELNRAQADVDALEAQIASHRSQIYADWCKFMLRRRGGHGVRNQPEAAAAQTYIGSTLIADELAALALTRTERTADLAAKRAAVESALTDGCALQSVAAPRFWAPHDPVVLLWGDGIAQPYRPLTERCTDDAGNLQCRLSTQIVDSLTLPSGAHAVTAAQLPALHAAPVHAAALSALVAEAFLLDFEQALLIAAAAGGTCSATDVQNAQAQLLSGGDAGKLGFSGLAPAPMAIQSWEQPWVPLLLAWQVEHYPAATVGDAPPNGYEPAFITSRYTLADGAVELADQQGPPPLWPDVEAYQGMSLLAPTNDVDIASRIDAYVADHPDDPHAAALKQIRGMCPLPAMAQALGGFNAALVMRQQTLQLQIGDPLAPLDGHAADAFSNTTVPGAVGTHQSTAALPFVSYNPLRAGWALISNLWIVDIFGQCRQIAPKTVFRAASMTPNDTSGLIGLVPRITQPSRLSLRWLSAADGTVETNAVADTSPICGWVLFNHLDDSLAVYDATGLMRGSLNVEGSLWLGPPGSGAGETVNRSLAGAAAGLLNFVWRVYHAGPEFLTDLLTAIDDAATLIAPHGAQQYGGLSALIGRPLAVVQASLSFELLGLPALHQGFEPLKQAAAGALPTAQRWNAGFTEVQAPVRLGDVANVSDGLVGYFAGSGTTFYAPAGPDGANGVAVPGSKTLVPAIGDDPMTLTMLIDPRAPVHATTGLLPVKQISIPPHMFAAVMKSLAVTFLTSPVLGPANAPLTLPLATVPGADWSWIGFDRQSHAWTDGTIGALDPGATGFATQSVREGWLKITPREKR